MDRGNIESLKEKLKYGGFDEKLQSEMEQNINGGKEAFQLQRTMLVGGKEMDCTLHFRQSDKNEQYYYNKFDAVLKAGEGQGGDRHHTFYQNQGVTAKEAFNLLEGRAVQKTLFNREGERYQAWMQLNLKAKDKNGNYVPKYYHENYGFDLKEALKGLPIKELGDAKQAGWLEKNLQKGNRYQVTMVRDGREEKMYVEANPRFKTVTVRDSQGKRVSGRSLSTGQEQGGGEKQGKEKSEGQKKEKTTAEKMEERKAAKQAPAKPRRGKGTKV